MTGDRRTGPAGRQGTAVVRRPSFDPSAALGWREIGLDGLGCLLRCVEAVLLSHGYDAQQVAHGLATPLDLVRRTDWFGPFGEYPGCTVPWRTETGAASHWPAVRDLVTEGTPVILMPDGYWWPGDEFEGAHHYHHHMVLAYAVDAGQLSFLDTDAPRAHGYVRTLPITRELELSCDRYATVTVSGPPSPRPSTAELTERLIQPSIEPLAHDIADLRAFSAHVWRGRRLPGRLARALDVLTLGDIQPELFLLAHALDGVPELADVAAVCAAAAARSQKLGLLLLGLHRFAADGIYSVAHEELVILVDKLNDVLAAMCRAVDREVPSATGTGERTLDRLRGLAGWCFGEGRSPADLRCE